MNKYENILNMLGCAGLWIFMVAAGIFFVVIHSIYHYWRR